MTVIEFDVMVLDGEGHPVPEVEVGARFRYANQARSWSVETTDGDGCAWFRDQHREPPIDVCLFIEDCDCGSYTVEDGEHLTVEM